MRRQLNAIGFISTDVMNVRWDDDFRRPVTIDVTDRGVVVEHTVGVSTVVAQLRPTRTERTIMLKNPGIHPAIHRAGNDDLLGSVTVDIRNRQAAQLIGCRLLRPHRVAEMIEHMDVAAPVRGDNFQIAVRSNPSQPHPAKRDDPGGSTLHCTEPSFPLRTRTG